MLFIFSFLACAVMLRTPTAASQNVLDYNPEFGQYQDEGKCFPWKETLYMVYRNYEYDPYLGGNATCLKCAEVAPYVDSSTTVEIYYYPDTEENATLTLMSSPGYTVQNIVNVRSIGGAPGFEFNVTAAYTDCNCKIFRHMYIEGGKGCTLWVAESKLDAIETCCQFIFDLVCGASYKYLVYYPYCRD